MSNAEEPNEIVVPFHAPRRTLAPVRQVRSTLLASSMHALRTGGLYAEYERLLAPAYREAVLSVIAGVWLPIDVARAHYEACDRLGLTVHEQIEIACRVADRIHGTFFGMLVRVAAGTGVSPWTALTRSEQLRKRIFVGGGVTVIKVGPKEARTEILGLSLLSIPYFRNSLRGIFKGSCELFCACAYVHELRELSTESSVVLRISWA